jgi:aryl-alcohol dehydrogenase-like predicted oxidoreductase
MIIGGGLPQFARDVEQPVVGSALVGFRTSAEVSENLGALGWEISATDIAEVDTARHGAVTAPCGWLEV